MTLGGVVWKENCILVSDVNGKKEYVGCPEWKDNIFSYPDLGCVAECKGENWFEVLWADTKQIAARVIHCNLLYTVVLQLYYNNATELQQ